jgi:hypothetical protein
LNESGEPLQCWGHNKRGTPEALNKASLNVTFIKYILAGCMRTNVKN